MSSSIWRQSAKRFASAVALASVAALLAGCGGSDESSSTTSETSTTVAPATWTGPPSAKEDGTVPIGGFNEYAKTLPESKQDPESLAVEFVQPRQPAYTVTVHTVRAGGSTATVLQDDLEDDSVRAIRYELDFALVSGGKVLLSEARVAYKCQPQRGHQDFSPELCL